MAFYPHFTTRFIDCNRNYCRAKDSKCRQIKTIPDTESPSNLKHSSQVSFQNLQTLYVVWTVMECSGLHYDLFLLSFFNTPETHLVDSEDKRPKTLHVKPESNTSNSYASGMTYFTIKICFTSHSE